MFLWKEFDGNLEKRFGIPFFLSTNIHTGEYQNNVKVNKFNTYNLS